MAHVIVLDSLNEDIFVCGLCKCVFNSLELFLNHKRENCVKEIIIQNVPPEPDLQQNACNIHQEISTEVHTSPAPPPIIDELLGCNLCTKKFRNTKTLLSHMKTHNEKPYQCLICGRCFGQNSHLQRHIACHKVWPGSISETTAKHSDLELLSYSCSYCSLSLSNYNQYRSHLKNHTNLKKFKCLQGKCTDFYDTMDGLLQHVSLSHTSPVYACHICIKDFNSLESIASHQQCHMEYESSNNDSQVKLYKCSLCDAVYKKADKLSLHMVTESHNKPCIHCNKTFASDKRLRMHLQIHRKSKPFQCSICNSSFLMKKYLMTHMLKHGLKQFKCAVCKNMFKRQDLLQRHMRLHQMKKMLQCPFQDTLGCKKEFSRKDKLKLHVKCHTKHVAYQKNIKEKAAQDMIGTSEMCTLTTLDVTNNT